MPTGASIPAWFVQKVPNEWLDGEPDVRVDDDEVVVVLPITGGGDDPGALRDFREETREKRVEIARAAERRFGRKVSWGVRVGDTEAMFTSLSTPVMTRLKFDERRVLDTLVAAGVARSRSDALAWCVRLVGRHEADWLGELREALVHVDRVRAEGPTVV